MVILKHIAGVFNSLFNWQQTAEEAYYSGATDASDLERRMRNVQQGRAPWQRMGL